MRSSPVGFCQVALLPYIYISLMSSFHAPFSVQIREGPMVYIQSPLREPSFFCMLSSFGFFIFTTNSPTFQVAFPLVHILILIPSCAPSGRHIPTGSMTSNALNDGNSTRSIFAIVFFLRAPLFGSAYVHVVQSSQSSSFSIPDRLDYCNG